VRGEAAIEHTQRRVVCYGVSESDECVAHRSGKASVGPLAAGNDLYHTSKHVRIGRCTMNGTHEHDCSGSGVAATDSVEGSL